MGRDMRNLVLTLGDQLSRESKAFDGFDRAADAVWMAEVQEEATHVWSHKLRIALFLSAMRHFRDRLRRDGITVHYHQMTEHGRDERGEGFAAVLRQDAARLRPQPVGNYCRHCRYRPGEATGDHACPFTTLYWEFLDRHFDLLKENARLKFQIANVKAKRNDKSLMGKIRKRADLLRREWTG